MDTFWGGVARWLGVECEYETKGTGPLVDGESKFESTEDEGIGGSTAAQPRPINLVDNNDERSSFVVIQTRNLGYTHTGVLTKSVE
jgi:hypothetical protein